MRDNNALKKNIIKLLYRLIDNLLYFDNNEKRFRLYISTILKIKVFKLIYNKLRYSSYTRTYEKLIKELYIFDIITKLYEFIRYYSHY